MRKNTKPHERGDLILSDFLYYGDRESWVKKEKHGVALQIHNFFEPAEDCRALSGERAPGGHCQKSGHYGQVGAADMEVYREQSHGKNARRRADPVFRPPVPDGNGNR